VLADIGVQQVEHAAGQDIADLVQAQARLGETPDAQARDRLTERVAFRLVSVDLRVCFVVLRRAAAPRASGPTCPSRGISESVWKVTRTATKLLRATSVWRKSMSDLVEFTVGHDGAAIFEVPSGGAVRGTAPASRRGDALIVESGRSLEQVVGTIRPVIGVMLDAVKDMGPQEVTVECGVKLSVSAGAIVASGSADSHFILTCKWNRNAEGKDGQS